jgi:hypothetical protein
MSAYGIFEQQLIRTKIVSNSAIVEPEGSLLSPLISNPRQFRPFSTTDQVAHTLNLSLQPSDPSAAVPSIDRVSLVQPTKLPEESIQ